MPSIIKKKVNPKPAKSIAQFKLEVTEPAPTPKPLKPSQSPKPTEPPKSPIAVKKVDPPEALRPIAIKASSKQAQVIALLKNPQGAKLPELMQVTGWQAHSIRGFLSGMIKKKLNLNLISQKHDGAQIYRIASGN